MFIFYIALSPKNFNYKIINKLNTAKVVYICESALEKLSLKDKSILLVCFKAKKIDVYIIADRSPIDSVIHHRGCMRYIKAVILPEMIPSGIPENTIFILKDGIYTVDAVQVFDAFKIIIENDGSLAAKSV